MKITFRTVSLLAAVIVIGLGQLDAARAPGPPKIGIMYLTANDGAGDPIHDLSQDPEWTNPLVQGVALRTQWGRVQPTPNSFYWGFLDQGMALAAQYGKKVSILVTAGVTTPQWVFDAGAVPFYVTDGSGGPSPMPLPWDPVFQQKWGAFVDALAVRYGNNPNLAYVLISGSGRRAESYLATTPADQQNFNRVGGLPRWKQGVQWLITKYAQDFPTVPFLLVLGSPVPTTAGQNALASVCNFGAFTFRGRFGVRSDGLGADYDLNSFGATEVTLLSPSTTVGYQMGLPQRGATDNNGVLTLDIALNTGINLGADFIEVYGSDCDDPVEAQVLVNARVRMLGH